MFAPTKTWRRWHRKVNTTMKRHAVASALAASSVLGLVQARGHQVSNVPELPLIVSSAAESLQKTFNAVDVLSKFKADDDVQRVQDSRKIRCGKGKMRNRRHCVRRGPLVIYKSNKGIVQAFRNIPGIELCCVTRLNLLQLAPGGHVGRFIIWTEDAFKALDSLYGTYHGGSSKSGYSLPRSLTSNADLARLINSDEVQSVLRPKRKTTKVPLKKNALVNWGTMLKLNPFRATERRRAQKVPNPKADKVKSEKSRAGQKRVRKISTSVSAGKKLRLV
jgi:large subunit ribosomal protein L4e